MTRDEFEDKQFQLSVMAGMNQRYHQIYANWWQSWNRFVQITVAIFAVASLILACIAPFAKSTHVDVWSCIVAGIAVVAAIALNVVPIGDWAQEHLDHFRRWTDLREDTDALLFDLTDDATPQLVERLKVIDAKGHRICGSELGCKEKLVKKCYIAEMRSRKPGNMCDEKSPETAAVG